MLSGSIHNITNKVDVKEEIKYTKGKVYKILTNSQYNTIQAQMHRSYSDVGIWFSKVILKLCNNHVYANYFLLWIIKGWDDEKIVVLN